MRLPYISYACVMTLAAAQLCFAQQHTAATGAARPAAQQALPLAQQNQSAGAPASSATASPASTAAIPSYPDSTKGLGNLMKEMLTLQKRGDTAALAPYLQSLILPHPYSWFRATFGDEIGSQLADSYQRTRMQLALSFPNTLVQLTSKHFGNPKAVLFTDSCNPESTIAEYNVLMNRTKEQPLYDVRFTSGSKTEVLTYFTYVDGAFRFIGDFQVGISPTRIVKISGDLLHKRAIKLVAPVYPVDAKIGHIQGRVILHVIIGETGQVCSLELVQGNSLLASAAIAAVRQWRFSPFTLEGHTVSVDSTITVIFQLGE